MIMPSAQYVELDQLPGVPDTGNLHSLLSEIHASNISYLNSVHGRGKVLFSEGDAARGVYILRTGRATVSISSSEGRIVITRLAQPGDVMGLNSVLRSSSYDATVKTLEPCRTEFIPRAELIELIEKSDAGARAVLKILSHELTELTDRTRSLVLRQTASARLARLLLEWSKKSVRIDRVFTHEEIAQMICSSRETVTRTLANLGRRKIIEITSDSILICDRAALERMTLG
jgi:CRP/FNR family transcriptional regulator, cyclic AMP receptor protein